MEKIRVLITGRDGLLGTTLHQLVEENLHLDFIFTNRKSLDVLNERSIRNFFDKNRIDYCINCAAYTNVDKAEEEKELAKKVNVIGVANLVESCKKHHVKLIHISTDYVFNGRSNNPYSEGDIPNPINYYGKTKLLGEQEVQKMHNNFFIIRTSWLYGKKGTNFVKTMLKLAKTKKEISVVDDQIGNPTNAIDLAKFILYLIGSDNRNYGIYNFTNEGKTSWFEFAIEIFKYSKVAIKVNRISSDLYPTIAIRPKNSTFSLEKLKTINYPTRDWKIALKEFITNLK